MIDGGCRAVFAPTADPGRKASPALASRSCAGTTSRSALLSKAANAGSMEKHMPSSSSFVSPSIMYGGSCVARPEARCPVRWIKYSAVARVGDHLACCQVDLLARDSRPDGLEAGLPREPRRFRDDLALLVGWLADVDGAGGVRAVAVLDAAEVEDDPQPSRSSTGAAGSTRSKGGQRYGAVSGPARRESRGGAYGRGRLAWRGDDRRRGLRKLLGSPAYDRPGPSLRPAVCYRRRNRANRRPSPSIAQVADPPPPPSPAPPPPSPPGGRLAPAAALTPIARSRAS